MKSLFILVGFAAISSTSFASDIRVRNATGVELKSVVVGGKNYGDIKPGGVSGYQYWATAYRYSSFSVLVNSKKQRFTPDDYLGEGALGIGKYTYVLTLKNEYIQIHAVKDAE